MKAAHFSEILAAWLFANSMKNPQLQIRQGVSMYSALARLPFFS